jgi:RimJ/RimL family protein N-acetyltransferase
MPLASTNDGRRTALREAPRLETARLVLRAHRAADLEALACMWADPVVVRHISGQPSTRAESWARLLRYAGHWALLGFGYWAIEERASGRFVGEVGLADFKRQMEPSPGNDPEIGWVLAPHAHGRGLATEAVARVVAWADEELGVRTWCMIHPDNTASLRVAGKCGYVEWQRNEYLGSPNVLFRRECGSRE